MSPDEQARQQNEKEKVTRVVGVPRSAHGDLPQRATGDKR